MCADFGYKVIRIQDLILESVTVVRCTLIWYVRLQNLQFGTNPVKCTATTIPNLGGPRLIKVKGATYPYWGVGGWRGAHLPS